MGKKGKGAVWVSGSWFRVSGFWGRRSSQGGIKAACLGALPLKEAWFLTRVAVVTIRLTVPGNRVNVLRKLHGKC
jgi:hypothetical protein